MLVEGTRRHLLAVARDAICQHLGLPANTPAPHPDPALNEGRPAFVTINKAGRLRGCVGTMAPRGTLEETVAWCAVAAAASDPRFPPLRAEELAQVLLEVSLLSDPTPVSGPDEIEVGQHGIIVSQGERRGLLLPQVAAGRRWTAEDLLAQAALKAGLRPDGWRAARLQVFTAEVFGEE